MGSRYFGEIEPTGFIQEKQLELELMVPFLKEGNFGEGGQVCN